MKVTFENYKKSNDDKYLTEIKDITGKSVNDEQLMILVSKDINNFKEKINNIYVTKRNSRIETLGESQNKILEKKIFLQIIDFSWRSHLQYLEQLRQVIGLRQYGQKDPLSEFKKEAFTLFEGLLQKIKKDVIKLLLNLNIIVSSEEEQNNQKNVYNNPDTKKIGRNEKCPCGSGKKYKYCHGSV